MKIYHNQDRRSLLKTVAASTIISSEMFSDNAWEVLSPIALLPYPQRR